MDQDQETLIRLEVEVQNLGRQMLKVVAATEAMQTIVSTVQRHEDRIVDHGKDISAAHKGLERTNEFMHSTRGGMKVLFWVVGLFSGAMTTMLGGVFWLLLHQIQQDQHRDDQLNYVQQKLDDHLKGNHDGQLQQNFPPGSSGGGRP